jgi:exodeoxyribonuclease V gamma subunit
LLSQLENFRGLHPVPRAIECWFDDGLLLFGEVSACYPDTGLMHFSASKEVKGRSSLSLWLNHLALCATHQLPRHESSQLFIPAATGLRFEYLDASRAKELLANYIELFRQGLERPLPVFPNTSYAWALEPDPDRAMKKALSVWLGANYRNAARGESEDDFIRLALRNYSVNPLIDPLFQDYARQIYLPAIENSVYRD